MLHILVKLLKFFKFSFGICTSEIPDVVGDGTCKKSSALSCRGAFLGPD